MPLILNGAQPPAFDIEAFSLFRCSYGNADLTKVDTHDLGQGGLDSGLLLDLEEQMLGRWKIERSFAWLNAFRGLVTRYERKAINDLAMLHLWAALCWARRLAALDY